MGYMCRYALNSNALSHNKHITYPFSDERLMM